MQTTITSLFTLSLDQDSLTAALSAAAISDFTVTGFGQSQNVITLTANRVLTSSEKTSLAAALMARAITLS
jgi:hypothetical protein